MAKGPKSLSLGLGLQLFYFVVPESRIRAIDFLLSRVHAILHEAENFLAKWLQVFGDLHMREEVRRDWMQGKGKCSGKPQSLGSG